MKKLLAAACAALIAMTCAPVQAQVPVAYEAQVSGRTTVVPVTAANPLPTTATVIGGGTTVKATAAAPTFVEGSTTNQLSADLSGGLRISGTVSATSTTKATAADPTYVEGSTTNPVSADLAGYARSLAKQSGSWNITNIAGTVSLPTGAATSAKQDTEIGSLSSIVTNTGLGSTAANQSSVIGTKAAGTAATNSLLTGGIYTSAGITLTNGQQAALQFDSTGHLLTTASIGGISQGSTTSGQTGVLNMGAVTTAAPSYTTAQTSPLSLTTTGDLRVSSALGSTAALQGAQGTGSTYDPPTGGTGEIGYLSGIYAAAVSTAASAVNLTQIGGSTISTGNGVTGATSQRVTIASDNTAFTVNLGTIGAAATAAKQPALGTAGTASADVITVQGVASMTALKVDGSAVTQPVSGTVTTAASENHTGEVGGNQISIAATPTLTATTYTTGQALGALQTLASAERVAGKGGLVQSTVIALKVANTVSIDVFYFNANPSGSTCTNASAFVLAAADIGKVVAVAHITDWTAGNTASFGQSQNMAAPFVLPSGTSLFACAVARGSIVTTGTSDLVETTNAIRN